MRWVIFDVADARSLIFDVIRVEVREASPQRTVGSSSCVPYNQPRTTATSQSRWFMLQRGVVHGVYGIFSFDEAVPDLHSCAVLTCFRVLRLLGADEGGMLWAVE